MSQVATGVPTRLRRQWWLTAVCFWAVTVAATLAVGGTFEAGGRWLVGTAVVAGYLLWFLRRSLGRNHPDADREAGVTGAVSPTLGVANAVTLGRGWLYAAVAGFLFVVPPLGSPWRWVPFLLYGTGAALDAVDGPLARTVGRETALGTKLDMACDTVGFLVAPLVGVVWGSLPVWYLSLSVARYLFKFGRGWRRRQGRPVYDLPESRVRRPLAGVQMAFITAALCPLVPRSVVWPAAAVVVTPSLVVFARDYLVVAGYLGESAKT